MVPESLNGQVCSTGYFILRPQPELTPRFIYYFLQTNDFMDRMEAIQKGASYPAVNDSEVRSQKLPVPPLPEQQRIVWILDEAFAGIAAATTHAEKNLHNARELFQSVLQSTFSQKGDDWVETTIGEVCTLKSGTTINKDLEQPTGDIPYLKVADMTISGNERVVVSSSRFLDRNEIRETAVFPVGTTIFPKRGGAIATNKKRLTAVPICADLNIMGVIPSERLDPSFLYLYFVNVDMNELGSGTTIPQINNYDIDPLIISHPPTLSTQQAIVEKLDAVSEGTKRLAAIYGRKQAALAEIKQSLLHKAFAGEL